jgi:hypothetical protein
VLEGLGQAAERVGVVVGDARGERPAGHELALRDQLVEPLDRVGDLHAAQVLDLGQVRAERGEVEGVGAEHRVRTARPDRRCDLLRLPVEALLVADVERHPPGARLRVAEQPERGTTALEQLDQVEQRPAVPGLERVAVADEEQRFGAVHARRAPGLAEPVALAAVLGERVADCVQPLQQPLVPRQRPCAPERLRPQRVHAGQRLDVGVELDADVAAAAQVALEDGVARRVADLLTRRPSPEWLWILYSR